MKAKLSIKVVEIEKKNVLKLDEKSVAPFVARLKDDPGFQFLVAKLEAQRAALRSALETNRHKTKEDFEFLQSGINWCGWLQSQVETAVGILNQPAPRPARAYEMEAFEQLRHNVELVGLQTNATSVGDVTPQG
jgi:hypothetical protein